MPAYSLAQVLRNWRRMFSTKVRSYSEKEERIWLTKQASQRRRKQEKPKMEKLKEALETAVQEV